MKAKIKRTTNYNSFDIDQDLLKDECKQFLSQEVKEFSGSHFNPTSFVASILKKDDSKLVSLFYLEFMYKLANKYQDIMQKEKDADELV